VTELDRERFTLTPPPQVRSLAIASLVAILGAALTVSSRALGLGPVVLVLGIVALALSVALLLAVVILASRLHSTFVLETDKITVIRGWRTQRLDWSEIDSVTLAGHRLTFLTRAASGAELSVINPRSEGDPTFTALIAAIRARLDADRGYRTG
jgi:hypothetical protein